MDVDASVARLLQDSELNSELHARRKTQQDLRRRLSEAYTLQDWSLQSVEQAALDEEDLRLRERLRQAGALPERADLTSVSDQLNSSSALVQFRNYDPVEFDFNVPSSEGTRWAALVITKGHEPVVLDLDRADRIRDNNEKLLESGYSNEEARKYLYWSLVAPISPFLSNIRTVYLVAPGDLQLVPFELLGPEPGKYWFRDPVETKIRYLAKPSSLLTLRNAVAAGNGLLAIGPADFGSEPEGCRVSQEHSNSCPTECGLGLALRGANLEFCPLRATSSEIEGVVDAFVKGGWPGHKPVPWLNSDASEENVKGLDWSPFAVHFMTHGFLFGPDADHPTVDPMLLSGIALYGANNSIETARRNLQGGEATVEDGVLRSVEVVTLPFQDTELVSFSACQTAQGRVDYAEGMLGLSRALHIAGARNVMLTRTSICGDAARIFAADFYHLWGMEKGSPAEVLHKLKLMYSVYPDPCLSSPAFWAPYIVVENGEPA